MGTENFFIVSVVRNRTTLDTKQQPKVIREEKILIKKKEGREKNSILLQKWKG